MARTPSSPGGAEESGSLHGEPSTSSSLPLHFLAGHSPVSLHTHSWSVPIPSSVSGLLVVHINYTFLSVCSVIFEWEFFDWGGGIRKERILLFHIIYLFSLFKNLVTTFFISWIN